MDKSGAGAGFLRELRFPLPTYIPYASPQSSSQSPEVGTIGQEFAAVPIASQTRIKKTIALSVFHALYNSQFFDDQRLKALVEANPCQTVRGMAQQSDTVQTFSCHFNLNRKSETS
jgi:hypothetical protein